MQATLLEWRVRFSELLVGVAIGACEFVQVNGLSKHNRLLLVKVNQVSPLGERPIQQPVGLLEFGYCVTCLIRPGLKRIDATRPGPLVVVGSCLRVADDYEVGPMPHADVSLLDVADPQSAAAVTC